MRVLQLGKFYDPVVGGMETRCGRYARRFTNRWISAWSWPIPGVAPSMKTRLCQSRAWPAWDGSFPVPWHRPFRFGRGDSMLM